MTKKIEEEQAELLSVIREGGHKLLGDLHAKVEKLNALYDKKEIGFDRWSDAHSNVVQQGQQVLLILTTASGGTASETAKSLWSILIEDDQERAEEIQQA